MAERTSWSAAAPEQASTPSRPQASTPQAATPEQALTRRLGRRHPVYFLATAGAVSTLIVLLSIVVMIVTWHPGGWV